jgi:hypothetical protein
MVMRGGLLGLHTCYRGASKTKAPECNDQVAQNAVGHGTAYGAVAAAMRYTDPDQVIWYDSWEADCWGLNRWPPDLKTQPAVAPCVLAALKGEKLPTRPPGQ